MEGSVRFIDVVFLLIWLSRKVCAPCSSLRGSNHLLRSRRGGVCTRSDVVQGLKERSKQIDFVDSSRSPASLTLEPLSKLSQNELAGSELSFPVPPPPAPDPS